MRGTIITRERKDGSSVYAIKYYDQFGKQRWETVGTSKREAERTLAARIRDAHYGELNPNARVTFADFIPTWDKQKSKEIRRTTMTNYRAHVRNHLAPAFGSMQLRQITLADVQRFVDHWTGDPATLRRVLATLSGIFKAAAVRGYMAPLDLRAVSKPRQRTTEAPYHVLTVPEIEHLMGCIDERYAPDVQWLAFTGLRRGEWIALPAKLIDLQKNVAIVARSVDHQGKIGPTKSGVNRKVALFGKAIEAYGMKQEVKRELHQADSEWAFPWHNGGMIQGHNFHTRIWRPAVIRAGMPDFRIHDLRHTAASLMIEAGAPAHFVAQQLGHTDPAFTMRAYAHWFEQKTGAVVQLVDAAFSSKPVAPLNGDDEDLAL